MAPPSFVDLGKQARDLFNKGYSKFSIYKFSFVSLKQTKIYNHHENLTRLYICESLREENLVGYKYCFIYVYFIVTFSDHGFLNFDSTTISGQKGEIQFKTNANHNLTSQKLGGNLEVQYKVPEYGVVITEKWNTENVLGTVLEVNDQFARGLKVTVDSSYTPSNAKRDAVVKTEWANELFKVNSLLITISFLKTMFLIYSFDECKLG